jgi:hypothetical protein
MMALHARKAALLLFAVLAVSATSARAALFSLSASGTISSNSSGDATIPAGTPWTFEIRYDTDAPDLDFELTGSPDPTFGRFANTGAPPAMLFFHYRAGDYEVTIDDPADFDTASVIDITFTSIHAIDINVHAAALFPPLAGGAVSFHADFNDFSSRPIFTSDGLPTNPALGVDSFDQSTVTLLPPSGAVESNSLTNLTVTAVPEPCASALAVVVVPVLLVMAGKTSRSPARSNGAAAISRSEIAAFSCRAPRA